MAPCSRETRNNTYNTTPENELKTNERQKRTKRKQLVWLACVFAVNTLPTRSLANHICQQKLANFSSTNKLLNQIRDLKFEISNRRCQISNRTLRPTPYYRRSPANITNPVSKWQISVGNCHCE